MLDCSCALLLNPFYIDIESYAILYCSTLGKPVDLKGRVDYVQTVFVYTKKVDTSKQVPN